MGVFRYNQIPQYPRGKPPPPPPVPITYEAGWAPESVWTLRREIFYQPGIEPRFLGCPARSLVILSASSVVSSKPLLFKWVCTNWLLWCMTNFKLPMPVVKTANFKKNNLLYKRRNWFACVGINKSFKVPVSPRKVGAMMLRLSLTSLAND
jgi:hypothetical protein